MAVPLRYNVVYFFRFTSKLLNLLTRFTSKLLSPLTCFVITFSLRRKRDVQRISVC